MPISFICLSQELVDQIVDYIACYAETNRKILRYSSLISRAFVERSQWHLFRNLSFVRKGEQSSLQIKIDRFRDLFHTKQRLARYPRHLELCSIYDDFRWLHESENLLSVMAQLDNLEEVVIAGSTGVKDTSMRTFHDSQAILEKFWKPYVQGRITVLTVECIYEAPLELVACPKLVRLDLIRSTFATPDDSVESKPLRMQILNCTSTGSGFSILARRKNPNGTPLLNFSNLTDLQITRNLDTIESDAKAINNNVLSYSTRCLRNLLFSDFYSDDLASTPLDIGGMNVLESIELALTIPSQYKPTSYPDKISAVIDILRSTPSQTTLSSLILHVRVQALPRSIEWIRVRDWSMLDAAISHWQQKRGKPVTFNLHFDSIFFEFEETAAYLEHEWELENFAQKLPLLSANPSVKFERTYGLYKYRPRLWP